MSADGRRWFLINASPDLRVQIESFSPLQPQTGRGTPIEGVLITNADLDHVLGLFLLRESSELTIYATPAVRETLTTGLRLEAVLDAFLAIRWRDAASENTPLLDRTGAESGLSFRMIPLPGGPPPYARDLGGMQGHSAAFHVTDNASGKRLVVAPDVAEVTPALREAIAESNAVLLDGTFWANGELRALRPGARTAREMGHVPISGEGGTLELMRAAPARLKGYMHINNTNPILMPGTPERAAVENAGIVVPGDGWEFEL